MQVQVRVTPKKFKPIIPDKWGGAIWALLFVAAIVRNIVSVIASFSGLESAAEITLCVIECALYYGVIPLLVCYVFLLVLFTMSARRRTVFCRRNDFVYVCMLFTAGAYFVMGVIECFAFLNSAVLPYTSLLLNMTVLTGAYCAMFFTVFAPRMDPRQKYYNFAAWASLYLGLQGLLTLFSSVSYIVLFYNDSVNEAVMEILEAYYGAAVTIDSGYATAGIIALCLLAAWVTAAAVVAAVLSKKAKGYVPPAEESGAFPFGASGAPRQESEKSPFDELNGGGNDGGGGADGTVSGGGEGKVFDEFDL